MPSPEGIVTPETATPAAAPPAPSLATPDPPAAKDDKDPAWLPSRLERERKTLLKSLGIDTEADGKAAIAAYRAQQEASKSEAQKAAERIATLELQAQKLVDAQAVIAKRADVELRGLSDTQRAAVVEAAGADPGRQLSIIDAFKPTWAAATPAANVAPPVAPPVPPLPAPAQTVPNAPAPPPAAPGGTPNWAQIIRDQESTGGTAGLLIAAALRAAHPEVAEALTK